MAGAERAAAVTARMAMPSAVSTFSRQQVALEASQRTYAQMSRLSLFDYL